jgi:hypothetical protein
MCVCALGIVMGVILGVGFVGFLDVVDYFVIASGCDALRYACQSAHPA